MTRKDYVAAADALARVRPPKVSFHHPEGNTAVERARIVWDDCVYAMAEVFADDNPRFDRQRFYDAAGASVAAGGWNYQA